MITQQSQVKLNLPVALKDFLESKANKYGMPVAGYIKHLILKDVADMDYPTFELSERAEKALEKALKDRNKAVTVKGDVGTFLKNL